MTLENHSEIYSQVRKDRIIGIIVGVVLMATLLGALFSSFFIIISLDNIDLYFVLAVIVMIVSIIVSKYAYSSQSEYVIHPRLKTFSKFYKGYKAIDVALQAKNNGKKTKAIEKIQDIIEMIELWNERDTPSAFHSGIPELILKNLQNKIIPTLKNTKIELDSKNNAFHIFRKSLFDITDKLSLDEPTLDDWTKFNSEIDHFATIITLEIKQRKIPLLMILVSLFAGGPVFGYAIYPTFIEMAIDPGTALFNSIVIALAWMAVVGPFIGLIFNKRL